MSVKYLLPVLNPNSEAIITYIGEVVEALLNSLSSSYIELEKWPLKIPLS